MSQPQGVQETQSRTRKGNISKTRTLGEKANSIKWIGL